MHPRAIIQAYRQVKNLVLSAFSVLSSALLCLIGYTACSTAVQQLVWPAVAFSKAQASMYPPACEASHAMMHMAKKTASIMRRAGSRR